jgi:lipoprotein Spr
VKNFFYVICVTGLFASCASTKSSSAVGHSTKPSASEDPKFLDNITIRPGSVINDNTHKPVPVRDNHHVAGSVYSSDIESCNELQFKYAILMEDKVENVTNEKLISFLEEWYGIPYKYGGGKKTGIDCSAFSSMMMDSVYNLTIPRTCRDQYEAGRKIKKGQLTQGDLVFFNTTGGVSHVGVYLGHNKFVHASTSNGVMISDMDDIYFKRRYVGASRIR